MNNLVTREDIGRIAVLTLNNPPANGYSLPMHQALDAHVVDLRMDDGIDVIVIRGAGDKFFCAGADIGYLGTLTPTQKYAFCLHANETLLRLENTPKLVIAALNGHCVGGGLEIALACDLRVGRASGEKPIQVGLPEVTLGVLPGTGGTQRLSRIIGRAAALRMMVEGRNLSVEDAVDAGLVHFTLPSAGWWEAVLDYAGSFVLPGKAAGAVGLIKRAVVGGADLPLESGLALERELQQRLFSAPDAREGIEAFLGKRSPHFVGFGGGNVGTNADTNAGEKKPRSRVVPSASPPRDTNAASTGTTGLVVGRAPPPSNDDGAREASAKTESHRSPSPSGLHPRIDLARTRLHDDVLNLLSRDAVEQCKAIPIRREGEILIVAMAFPEDAEAVARLASECGMQIRPVAADLVEIATAVAWHYRA